LLHECPRPSVRQRFNQENKRRCDNDYCQHFIGECADDYVYTELTCCAQFRINKDNSITRKEFCHNNSYTPKFVTYNSEQQCQFILPNGHRCINQLEFSNTQFCYHYDEYTDSNDTFHRKQTEICRFNPNREQIQQSANVKILQAQYREDHYEALQENVAYLSTIENQKKVLPTIHNWSVSGKIHYDQGNCTELTYFNNGNKKDIDWYLDNCISDLSNGWQY